VSSALKRLRDMSGDPLLVRSGAHMVPTEAGLRMLEPAAHILRSAETLFSDARGFEPTTSEHRFSVAASDYLDPQFLPQLVSRLKQSAPMCPIEIHSLTGKADYRHQLAQGEVDVVIGNWPKPPGDLHLGRLFGDEVVCLVSQNHPAVRRGWTPAEWLDAEHIAPMPTHPGARGVIDEHLDAQGLVRRVTTRCAHFGLIPGMVASSLLVLTTGRQYCERYVGQLPLTILVPPVAFPRMMYYQLWHERSHQSSAARWLREQIKTVAATLRKTP
jgi:DNA-binding transcriptional LysR family regulator